MVVQPQIPNPSRDKFETQKQINNASSLWTIMLMNQIQFQGEVATAALLPIVGNEYDAYVTVDKRYTWIRCGGVWVRLDQFMIDQLGLSGGNTVVQTFADYNAMLAGVNPAKDGIFVVTNVNGQDPSDPTITGPQNYIYDQATTTYTLIKPADATQAESDAGTVDDKYVSPKTANPGNHPALVGGFDANDGIPMRSINDAKVVKVTPTQIAALGATPEASQAEADAGTIVGKFMSPSTANPNNYPALAGAIDALDAIRVRSVNDGKVVKYTPQSIADLASVPIDSTTALVNDQGNNATGEVGNAAKPFLTAAAALAAIPSFGIIRAEGSELIGSFGSSLSFFNLILDDAEIVGDITGFFVNIRGTTSGSGDEGSIITGNIKVAQLQLSGLSDFVGNISGKTVGDSCEFKIRDMGNMSTNGAALIGDGSSVYTGTIDTVDNLTALSGSIISDLLTNGGPGVDISMTNIGAISAVDIWTGLGSPGTLSLANISSLKVDNAIYGGPIISARILNLNNCYFANKIASGNVIDVSGVGTISIRSYNSVYEITDTGAVVWATNPIGAVTLISSSLLNKPRDVSGVVVVQTVNNDVIDALITVL